MPSSLINMVYASLIVTLITRALPTLTIYLKQLPLSQPIFSNRSKVQTSMGTIQPLFQLLPILRLHNCLEKHNRLSSSNFSLLNRDKHMRPSGKIAQSFHGPTLCLRPSAPSRLLQTSNSLVLFLSSLL